jgi:NADPH:quinone reductase-like Zn-dependent oxidoreductase
MKIASIQTFGGPDVVVLADASERAPLPHEVGVRIEVAGVNPLDLKILAGYLEQVFPVTFPYTLGTDFSGVIETVGAEVTAFQPGDRVVGRTSPSAGGAFAGRVVIAASDIVAMPPEMSFEQAAALPTTFGTARQALFDVGKLRAGQRVLIHAAAGGVGVMAVQQAHHADAFVIATASARNADLVRALGADVVIDYREADFAAAKDVDLVLDTIGGETLQRSWPLLRHGGRIASLVEFGIQTTGGHAGDFVFFADATRYLPDAIAMFLAGDLEIVTDSIFPLEETRSALEKLQTGHACGKVLIRVSH